MKLLRTSLHSLPWSKYISSYVSWVFGCYQSCCKDHLPPHGATAPALHHVGRQTQADFHSGKVLRKGKRGWKLLGIANQLRELPKPPRTSAQARYPGAAKWGCQLQYHMSLSTKVTFGIWLPKPKKKGHFPFTNPHYSYLSQYLSVNGCIQRSERTFPTLIIL